MIKKKKRDSARAHRKYSPNGPSFQTEPKNGLWPSSEITRAAATTAAIGDDGVRPSRGDS
jgi:hypothetical protein